MTRLPSLDGLRALAITIVLVAHCNHFFPVGPQVESLLDIGHFGVQIFFVISGFLITTLLLAERRRTGRIDLVQFYVRRTLRIFPAYYAFLLIMLVARSINLATFTTSDLWHAATYRTNFLTPAWDLGHTWSLSVEEQFYLVWPAVLVALGPRGGLAVAAGLLVVCPVSRYYQLPAHNLDWAADSLAIGCILAAIRSRLERVNPLRRPSAVTAAIGLSFAAGVGIEILGKHPSLVRADIFRLCFASMENVASMMVVFLAVTFPTCLAGRLLNTRPLVAVGKLSYSIYLWQEPFINPELGAGPWTLLWRIPASVLSATVSYFGIEQPVLDWRQRLVRRSAVAPVRPLSAERVESS